MTLDFDSFSLRAFRGADAPSMVRYANNRNVSRNLRDGFPYPYGLDDAHRALAKFEGSPLVFCIDVGGEAVGGIGVHTLDDVYRRGAELGYWLGEPFWGRGIATRAVSAITEHAFHQRTDLVRIQAAVFSWNPASGRVLEKVGYEREGVLRQSVFKDGVLGDSICYAKLR